MVTQAILNQWRRDKLVIVDGRRFQCPCTGYTYSRTHVRQHARSKTHRKWAEGRL